MSSPPAESVRAVLIESLGGLSEEEKSKLHGPSWALFAHRKVQSLKEARKWVLALGTTMALFAVALPTTAFYHYYEATESFSVLGFLAVIAAACAFAAAQMGWAVYMYMSWRRQLQCYKGLRALGRESAPEGNDAEAPAAHDG